jgi:hypothetical protein
MRRSFPGIRPGSDRQVAFGNVHGCRTKCTGQELDTTHSGHWKSDISDLRWEKNDSIQALSISSLYANGSQPFLVARVSYYTAGRCTLGIHDLNESGFQSGHWLFWGNLGQSEKCRFSTLSPIFNCEISAFSFQLWNLHNIRNGKHFA